MEYEELASAEIVNKTTKALKGKGYEVFVVKSGKEALEKIKEIIPEGTSVINGSSTTLTQIGYDDYLKSGRHKWDDLLGSVHAENDKDKRKELRRQSALSDFYLGSVHALVETGEFVIASNTGSQMPHIVYTSPNLIFVVSTKKIAANLDEGMKRLKEHVYPLEEKDMMSLYNTHTAINKIIIFNGEATSSTRKIRFILVEENLGF